jgi:hypothetical protein
VQTLKFFERLYKQSKNGLIIDYVSNNLSFLEEIKTYLTIPFAKGSIFVVTAPRGGHFTILCVNTCVKGVFK